MINHHPHCATHARHRYHRVYKFIRRPEKLRDRFITAKPPGLPDSAKAWYNFASQLAATRPLDLRSSRAGKFNKNRPLEFFSLPARAIFIRPSSLSLPLVVPRTYPAVSFYQRRKCAWRIASLSFLVYLYFVPPAVCGYIVCLSVKLALSRGLILSL